MDEARLRAIPLFAGLSKKERRAVARQAEEVDVEPGCCLVREGDFSYEFFAIETGTVVVRRGEQYLDELGPGEFFGEMGLVGESRRGASVTAQSAVRAIVLTAWAFHQIDRELPAVARRIRKEIAARRDHLEPVG
jgi:CRP-like cAMP-binding protein